MPLLTFEPSGHTHPVKAGTSLLHACHEAGMAVPGGCGGCGLCGSCRVRIVAGDVPPHADYEHALSEAEMDAGWRLACLVRVSSDLTVHVPEAPAACAASIPAFACGSIKPVHACRAVPLPLSPPTRDDPRPDVQRLLEAPGLPPNIRVPIRLLRHLPARLRAWDWHLTAVVHGDACLALLPYEETPALYGFACDIGTTTLAGVLVDLRSGADLAHVACVNPQALHGDDVMTRLAYVRAHPRTPFDADATLGQGVDAVGSCGVDGADGATAGGRDGCAHLQHLVVGALQTLLEEACLQVDVPLSRVFRIHVCGNTTMHHLLFGLDPAPLALSPFLPTTHAGLACPAAEVGLSVGEGAVLSGMPNPHAFVGGDLVAGILAHGIHDETRTVLLVDVGTNGEIALRHDGTTYVCSTAAGPAFEGAGIGCGLRATSGAIHAVDVVDGDLRIRTLDDAPAHGVCGTGLLDALAALRILDVMDETGRIQPAEEYARLHPDAPPSLCARLQPGRHGTRVRLSEGRDGEPELFLTQKDVRALQLSKAALAAGISLMLDRVGVPPTDVDEVLLAGAFGSALRPESALCTGLLPTGFRVGRIRAVGNAALAGTYRCLLRTEAEGMADRIAGEVVHVGLAGEAAFHDAFADAMEFPAPCTWCSPH